MIPKKRVPSGYGSVSSGAGPTGNPLFPRHQIISGHAARDSATNSRRPMPEMGGPSLRDYRIVSLPPGKPVGPWAKAELF